MLKINIETTGLHPYPTCGNWWTDKDGVIQVRVSRLGDERYEFLIALHEMIECYLCRYRGINEDTVTAFDLNHPDSPEPGCEINAPYHKEHMFADLIERLTAFELGIDWGVYEQAVMQSVGED